MAAGLGAHLGPTQLATIAGNDVDHAKKSIGPIHRRPRARYKLHPFHQVQVDGKVRADACLVIDVVVEAHTVDQQQHPRVVVAWRGKTPCAQIVVAAVVGHIQPAHAGQHIGQRAVAKQLDVIGGHHAHGRRGLQGRLLIAAGRGDLHLHELLQRQVGHGSDVGLRVRCRHASAQAQDHPWAVRPSSTGRSSFHGKGTAWGWRWSPLGTPLAGGKGR